MLTAHFALNVRDVSVLFLHETVTDRADLHKFFSFSIFCLERRVQSADELAFVESIK